MKLMKPWGVRPSPSVPRLSNHDCNELVHCITHAARTWPKIIGRSPKVINYNCALLAALCPVNNANATRLLFELAPGPLAIREQKDKGCLLCA